MLFVTTAPAVPWHGITIRGVGPLMTSPWSDSTEVEEADPWKSAVRTPARVEHVAHGTMSALMAVMFLGVI